MSNVINTWRGKDINTLSREELIEAVTFLGQEYMRYSNTPGIHEYIARKQVDQWRQSK